MKLLVVTYNALMTSTPNGRTMISLLEGYSPDEIVNFCVTGIPDEKYCSAAYKVSNSDALKSFVFCTEKGGKVSPLAADATNEVLAGELRKGERSPWKYYLRELAWKNGHWNGKRLKSWLKEQSFDCIVYMYGDGAALQNFSVFASEFLNVPLVVYSCEEYCFKDYNYLDRNDNSLFFKKYFKMSKEATKKLFARASALICNTDQLGRLFSETYGLPATTTIMMASDMEFIENSSVKSPQDMKISYCGTLGIARARMLLDIAKALSEIDAQLKLDVYGRASADVKKMLMSCPYLRFHGFVSYDEVQNVLRESTLLVQTLSFDDYYAKNRRFGFSTKNADSLACGTPYFLFEREEIVEMRFVKEHNCAFVASSREMLLPTLKTALFDETARKKTVANAKKVTEEYFNKKKNIETVHTVIENAVASNNDRVL